MNDHALDFNTFVFLLMVAENNYNIFNDQLGQIEMTI